MSEVTAPSNQESSERASPGSQRIWSFLAVAAAIIVGLSLLVGVALLLNRLLGNPPP